MMFTDENIKVNNNNNENTNVQNLLLFNYNNNYNKIRHAKQLLSNNFIIA